LDRVEHDFAGGTWPTPDEITSAFWCACHGGQRATAEYLLRHGADVNWVGYDKLTPLDAALRSGATELADWLRGQGAKSAKNPR
jgi:ankyrin repeat protein